MSNSFFGWLIVAYLLFPVIGLLEMQTNRPDSAQPPPVAGAVPNRRAVYYQQGRQLFRVGLVVAVCTFLSVIPQMGIPGTILLAAYEKIGLIEASFWVGDKGWPAAIFFSVIWPVGILLSIAIRNLLTMFITAPDWLVIVSVLTIWLVALPVVFKNI
jgi:hypothetical protein